MSLTVVQDFRIVHARNHGLELHNPGQHISYLPVWKIWKTGPPIQCRIVCQIYIDLLFHTELMSMSRQNVCIEAFRAAIAVPGMTFRRLESRTEIVLINWCQHHDEYDRR